MEEDKGCAYRALLSAVVDSFGFDSKHKGPDSGGRDEEPFLHICSAMPAKLPATRASTTVFDDVSGLCLRLYLLLAHDDYG